MTEMAIQGYVDYQRREYCKDIRCPIQVLMDQQREGDDTYNALRAICKSNCLHTTHEFHAWLIQHGYLVVKPAGGQ